MYGKYSDFENKYSCTLSIYSGNFYKYIVIYWYIGADVGYESGKYIEDIREIPAKYLGNIVEIYHPSFIILCASFDRLSITRESFTDLDKTTNQ